MRTAKNYEKWTWIGEPYQVHGHWYVRINLNGQPTEVRLYNDEEYEKMYPTNLIPQKEVLGFEADFITLIIGNTVPFTDWLHSIGARYHKIFQWYLPSLAEIPEIIPEGLSLKRITWAQVASGKYLKPDVELYELMRQIKFGHPKSQFVGKVGDRITLPLTVEKVITATTKYGETHVHIFKDTDENIFQWTTGTRLLDEHQTYQITGTLKTHEVYKGENRNILTRCQVHM